MLKYYYIVVLFVFSLVACKKEVKVELPFEEAKVVSLIGDMHFAKSASSIHKAALRDSMRVVYEDQVFVINEISREEYDDLMQILKSDLKLYYDIEKKVHSHLKSIQNKKS